MKIELEEKSKLVALGLGYFQFIETDSFEPAAIGLTSENIVLYSDYEPDEIQNNAFAFSIKKIVPLQQVKTVVIEKIRKNRELERFDRLVIIMKNVPDTITFYYDKRDAKYMKRVIGAFKYAEIRVVTRSVDLSPID